MATRRRTKVRAHPRRGTKGVGAHSRNRTGSDDLAVGDAVQFRYEPGTGGVIKHLASGMASVATSKGVREVPVDALRAIHPNHEARLRRSVASANRAGSNPTAGEGKRARAYAKAMQMPGLTHWEKVDMPNTIEDATPAKNPPKARGKEVRWYQGRWEKLMAKGWVPA